MIAAGIFCTGTISEMKAAPVFNILAFTALILDPSIALMRDAPKLESRILAFTEIQEFLSTEEIQDQRNFADELLINGVQRHARSLPASSTTAESPNVLEFRKVSIVFEPAPIPLLAGVDFSVQRGQRVVVTGAVGSGKTTVLRMITGEIPPTRGSVWLRNGDSSIAYCGQRLWLDDASIRSNITKGTVYDHVRYKRILWACVLDTDIESLPGLDMFRVGINGANLSGGQQQRVVSVELGSPSATTS